MSAATTNAIPTGRIGENRHICAFFHGEEERYRVLLPFIKEGFERGEKAFHIVDPKQRVTHAQRLESVGIDVIGSVADGRFELRTWEDAYFRNGYFDQEAMLRLLDEALSVAKLRGFPLTRLIANMEWALENRPESDDLIEYETKFNHQFPNCADWVLCTYDLSRFGADIVIDGMRTHPLILIGGVLHENPFFVPPDRFLRELRERKVLGG